MDRIPIYVYNSNLWIQLQFMDTTPVYGYNSSLWIELQFMYTTPVYGYNSSLFRNASDKQHEASLRY